MAPRESDSLIERHDRAVIATGSSIVSEAATFTCGNVAAPEEHMARVAMPPPPPQEPPPGHHGPWG